MTFEFLSDPGHGWLKVSKLNLERYLGPKWRKQFTCFSYESVLNVFLEEDCDFPRFISLMSDAGKEVEIKHLPQTNRPSKIRSYNPLAPM